MIRVLRILRTVDKLYAVHVVIKTLVVSLQSVAAITFVLLGVSVCYCVVAIDAFSGGVYDEFFHDLKHALLTCFQMMTFDSWSSLIRPMARTNSWWWALYWCSYIALSGFLLFNMLIAVFSTQMELAQHQVH